MRLPFASALWPLAFSALSMLACPGRASAPEAPAPERLLRSAGAIRFSFLESPPGPRDSPVYATFTGLDAAGRFCWVDRSGRVLPCSGADNVVPMDGRTWCAYSFPLDNADRLELDRGLTLTSGRLYLSIGAPLYLRVDERSGGLVQPDPANPTDPNRLTRFDWIELTLDRTGFHGNTTSVDQFGLPIALALFERGNPGQAVGRVGLDEARSELFRAFRAELPAAFAALADPQDTRILAPAHGAFGAGGSEPDYLREYVDRMWAKYRREPLVLTPDQGVYRGRVDARDRLVFTSPQHPGRFLIRGKPSSQEVFLCNGVLAQGNATERMLGAQIAALLNRHLLETPLAWRDPSRYYLQEPCNRYARFWHEHGLDRRAYGFAYDDVNDQSSSLASPDPLELRITFRRD